MFSTMRALRLLLFMVSLGEVLTVVVNGLL